MNGSQKKWLLIWVMRQRPRDMLQNYLKGIVTGSNGWLKEHRCDPIPAKSPSDINTAKEIKDEKK